MKLSYLKGGNIKGHEAVFWILVEKPMVSFKNLNDQRVVVHFSFGNYNVSKAWVVEAEVIRLMAAAGFN